MFAIGRKRQFLMLLPVLCVMAAALGCSSKTGDTDITTDFLEDTVVAVGTQRVSLAEWYLYAMPKVSAATAMYGSDIWKYRISDDEGSMADAVKQDILDQIVYIKIVCARAETLGISLNEDELTDIETETLSYMERLTESQKSRYSITEDVVHSVYCDNMLAMKVYENLTLNIDTDVPDEEVRHMVIEYICADKFFETGEDSKEKYSDEELDGIRSIVEDLYIRAADDPEITKLSQLGNEQYAAIEMVSDYAGLREKFPDEIADKIFNMRENEILGIFDTDESYFIFDCVKRNDEEATNEAKVGIIEQRQRELFEQSYAVWQEETVIKLNYTIWDAIGFYTR